jgi:hypothetical protein
MLPLFPRRPLLSGPDSSAPDLERGFKVAGDLVDQFFATIKGASECRGNEGTDTLCVDGTVCGALYVAGMSGLQVATCIQMDYRILGSARVSERAVWSSIADSVGGNCSMSLIVIESLSEHVRAEYDRLLEGTGVARGNLSENRCAKRIRLAEMLLLSFEMLRRENIRLADLVSGSGG